MLRNEDKRLYLGDIINRDALNHFPQFVLPGLLSSHGPASLVHEYCQMNAIASVAWPAANRAIYIPFLVERAVVATIIGWLNGATVNNGVNDMDVGIYSESGARLVSQGGTITQTPINVTQTADITDTTLKPGIYYLAMCVSNTTSTFQRSQPAALELQTAGVQQQAVGAVALPSPATFANPASAYVPLMGVAVKAVMQTHGTDPPLPLFVSSWSRWAIGGFISASGQRINASSIAWPSANRAIYVPMQLPWDYPVRRVWWYNGSSVTSVNMDLGIYTAAGARIYSTGSTAESGASAAQYTAPSPVFWLPAGGYYLALACSSTTANRGGSGFLTTFDLQMQRLAGMSQESNALPLPANMTPEQMASSIIPYFGITRTTSGF